MYDRAVRTHYRWVRWEQVSTWRLPWPARRRGWCSDRRRAERTGLQRELFLANRFAGPPLRSEVSDGISLDFLDEDTRFPRTLNASASGGTATGTSGGRPYRDPWSWRRLA